jgi:hypothetical protein
MMEGRNQSKQYDASTQQVSPRVFVSIMNAVLVLLTSSRALDRLKHSIFVKAFNPCICMVTIFLVHHFIRVGLFFLRTDEEKRRRGVSSAAACVYPRKLYTPFPRSEKMNFAFFQQQPAPLRHLTVLVVSFFLTARLECCRILVRVLHYWTTQWQNTPNS